MSGQPSDFFIIDESTSRIRITYRDKVKNLPFVIFLLVAAVALFIPAMKVGQVFMTILFIIFCSLMVGYAIYLFLIQWNWALEISNGALSIRTALGKWKAIDGIEEIELMAFFNQRRLAFRATKFYFSTLSLDFGNDDIRILLSSGGTFKVSKHQLRHSSFEAFAQWLAGKLGGLPVAVHSEPVNALGTARKTLY